MGMDWVSQIFLWDAVTVLALFIMVANFHNISYLKKLKFFLKCIYLIQNWNYTTSEKEVCNTEVQQLDVSSSPFLWGKTFVTFPKGIGLGSATMHLEVWPENT